MNVKLSSLYFIGEIGVDIDLPANVKSVSWLRNSLYSDYPENHIARNAGTAYKSGKIHNYDDDDMSRILWEDDMSAFVYYEKSSSYHHLASNDFRTKRLKISRFLVNMVNESKILVTADCGNINAYANPFNAKLQISKGYYKQSILWGNYWGKRFNLNQHHKFEFSVSFENSNHNGGNQNDKKGKSY